MKMFFFHIAKRKSVPNKSTLPKCVSSRLKRKRRKKYCMKIKCTRFRELCSHFCAHVFVFVCDNLSHTFGLRNSGLHHRCARASLPAHCHCITLIIWEGAVYLNLFHLPNCVYGLCSGSTCSNVDLFIFCLTCFFHSLVCFVQCLFFLRLVQRAYKLCASVFTWHNRLPHCMPNIVSETFINSQVVLIFLCRCYYFFASLISVALALFIYTVRPSGLVTDAYEQQWWRLGWAFFKWK